MFEGIEKKADERNVDLRLFRESDKKPLEEIASNYKIARWMSDSFPHPYKEEDAVFWVDENMHPSSWHRAITYERQLAGSIGVVLDDEDEGYANFGYWIGEKYWGNNVTTIAGKIYLTRFEERLKKSFKGLKAHTYRGNKPSEHLLKDKFGFEQQPGWTSMDVRGVERQARTYYLDFKE